MIYLYRVYQWCIAMPLMIILTLLTCVSAITASLLGFPDWGGYWPPMLWSRAVCLLAFVRVKVVGRENIDPKTAYVFVANHQGAFDIWAVYGYLNHPFKWLMKKSLEKVFMVGRACRAIRHVFVDDSSIQGIKDTISGAEKILQGNMSLFIFPEGHRSYDGKMNAFKRGAFMLAGEFKLPVVPVTIEGSFKAMARTSYNVTPCKVTLTIHKPIYPGERGFNTKQLMSECREAINSALLPENRDA